MPMQVEHIAINEILEYSKNARHISDSAIDAVAASIAAFGFKNPIIVDGNFEVIAGHTRLRAAKRLQMDTVPVIVADDLSPAAVKAYRLADNRLAQNTAWVPDLLGIEFRELQELDFDLHLTGFEDSELRAFLAEDTSQPLDSEENAAAPEPKPVSHTVKFTEEQFGVILQATAKLREQENDSNISEGRACELFAAEFLAS